MWTLVYAPDAFGFVNVIFFTLEGGDVSVARRASPTPVRPRAETSQRFDASRRFAFKDLNEVPRRAASVPIKSVAQKRPSRGSARLRWAMVHIINAPISRPFYTLGL